MTALLPLAINAKTTKWSGETLFDFDKTIPSYINLTENRDYKLSKYGTITLAIYRYDAETPITKFEIMYTSDLKGEQIIESYFNE